MLAIGRAKNGVGMLVEEGKEYNIERAVEWESLALNRGDVLEVHLPSTDCGCTGDLWSGFWVKRALIQATGEYMVVVKSLGCSDPDWAKYFSNQFNRKKGTIHLCTTTPCVVTEDYSMHVTRLRVFTTGAFARPYMGSYIKRQISKWEEEELSDEGDGVDISGDPPRRDGPDDADKEAEGPGAVDPRIRPTPKADAVPAGAPRLGERPKKERSKKPMEEKERHMLRQRLEAARAKMLDRGAGTPAGHAAEPGTYAEAFAVESSSPGYSASEPWGDDLQVKEDIGPEGAPNKKKKREPETRAKDIAKKKRRRVREPNDSGKGARGADLPALEDIRGNTTKNLQSQLIQVAAENAKEKEQKDRKEKRRHQKKTPAHQLAKILALAMGKKKNNRSEASTDSQEGSKKKKKKDKKRRKKKGTDESPSPDGGSSRTTSSEKDYDDASSSSSSKHKMDPPLTRKSKRKPGSVLAMLLEHARSQLDQNAKVGVGSEETLTLSSGVRMGSYFAIVVRPQVGGAMGQARELHHLAQAIDLLKGGSLDTLGDVLAGRFMSIHQSVLDGSWSTARHLELRPLEEGSAAGPAIVLAAKKHARLAARVAPGEAWTWQSGGKSKGGRGRGDTWTEAPNNNSNKGKGKKGPKGKGKGKTWGSTEKETEGKPKERIPEK